MRAAAGFADYPLIAYHFAQAGNVPGPEIAMFYAAAMGAGGGASLACGRLYDRYGMGVHESIVPSAVAPMVPGGKRASAFGLFTAGYGVCWLLGSGAIGILYQRSPMNAVLFCVATQAIAALCFLRLRRRSLCEG